MLTRFKKIKKESAFQNIFFSIMIGIFLFGTIGFLIISNFKINQKRSQLFGQIEKLEKEIRLLEEKNKELEAGISQTGEESYWEEKAREQGYKKPGEEAVVVLPPEGSSPFIEKEKGFWEKFLDPVRDFFRNL